MKKLALSCLFLTGCILRPGMPAITNGQYGTILPGHPECIAEKLRSDLLVNPDGSHLTQEQWDALGWDFKVRSGYLEWTRGSTVGYSSAEDSTVWNRLSCTKVKLNEAKSSGPTYQWCNFSGHCSPRFPSYSLGRGSHSRDL